MEILKLLLGSGLIFGVCYIVNILGKCYVASISKKLNNKKVKSLSKMMSKDININFPLK